jgi:beta-fructofuranosidase
VTLRLEDWLLWDFWLAPRRAPADPFHLFFLQAPRSLPDPELRHDRATVGHAVSADLVDWDYLGTALEPGPAGSWDDFTIWTGCVVWDGTAWRMYYTGRNRAEQGRVQRIGCAVSDDLLRWMRIGETPLLEADPAWCQQRDDERSSAADCRDPWIIRHGDRWLMYFTVSDRRIPRDRRGAVGLAESTDLETWRNRGSVTVGGHFGEIEVPQVFEAGGRWGMLFCTGQQSEERAAGGIQWTGSHCFFADSPYGPFTLCPEPPLLADDRGSLYAARLVDDPWIPRCLLAWRRWDETGAFAGDLTDPIPVARQDSCLRLLRDRTSGAIMP